MWTAVALTTVMTLAPAQTLDIKNVRTTYGTLGETRKDDKFLPGDMLVVAFDIEGLKAKDTGLVEYSIGMEVSKKGKAKFEFKQDPIELEAENILGGSTLPAFASWPIKVDAAPGEYTLKVTIKDLQSKAEKTLSKSFEVLAPRLGFVGVRLSAGNGDPVPPIAIPGQRVFLHCALVGFKLGKDGLPNVTFEMIVQDDAGKPTVAKSFKGDIKTDLKATPTPTVMVFRARQLDLNKAGKYKIVLKATCNHTKESTEQTMNLNVLSSAN